MTGFEELSSADQERLVAAAGWLERLRADPALELSQDFLTWTSDPVNLRALDAVKSTDAALADYAASPQILELRRAAMARLGEQRLGDDRLGDYRISQQKSWRRPWLAWAAAILVMLGGAGGYVYYQAHAPQVYATEIGAKRVVALPDGSRISLDSDSEVEVRYSDASRAIVLDRGRARFDVAHDMARPFTVAAGPQTVVAVGTTFDVEKLGPKVLITLIQGRILIKREDGTQAERGPSTVSLTAGEQLTALEHAAPVIRSADLDAAAGWEAGHLVFRGEPLGEAALRVNRYTENPIVVDPSAASIAISGVFNAGDVGAFVNAITGYFPVEATTDSDNRIVLQKRT